MHADHCPDETTCPDSDAYQALLAEESRVTWEKSLVSEGGPSPLLDRTAWSEERRGGPEWWHPDIDPEITWGRELRFVLAEARGRVLELGCGGGWLALELARRGLHVTGVDACAPLIEAAQEYARQQGLGEGELRFEVADLNAVSLPARTYDTVIAWQSLHHLLALPRLVREIRGTLTAGGVLLICDTVLDHSEVSVARAVLSLLRRAAKLLLLVLARAGRRRSDTTATARQDTRYLATDSPFERVGSVQIEAALLAEFSPVEVWHLGTWFWEGLPQYAAMTMSGSRWQQRAAVALLRLLRLTDRALLRVGFRGNYIAGKFTAR